MHWRVKAAIQKAIAKLPPVIGGPLYFQLQKNFGSANRASDFSNWLRLSAWIIRNLNKHGRGIEGATCLEVGTGYSLGIPIGLWLCGAERTISVDVSPYLKEELVTDGVEWIIENKSRVYEVFGELSASEGFASRFCSLENITLSLEEIKKHIGVEYRYPADASVLDLGPNTVDLHYSNSVLEHISPDEIKDILVEAERVLRTQGIFVHLVDTSDHFAHTDPRITSVNFLKFSENKWNRIAGNRFMYHTRLRASDLRNLCEESGLDILDEETLVNLEAKKQLDEGMQIDDKFAGHNSDDLATQWIYIVGNFKSQR